MLTLIPLHGMQNLLEYRIGKTSDLHQLKQLALVSFGQFQAVLTPENWEKMETSLSKDSTYTQLINSSIPFICTHNTDIVGMAFLVLSGNPTDIYPADCCYLRFVGVKPEFGGRGIAKELTRRGIAHAIQAGEKIMMLHTSEMMDAARHIYESLGFKKLREIDPRYGKKYWVYGLELDLP